MCPSPLVLLHFHVVYRSQPVGPVWPFSPMTVQPADALLRVNPSGLKAGASRILRPFQVSQVLFHGGRSLAKGGVIGGSVLSSPHKIKFVCFFVFQNCSCGRDAPHGHPRLVERQKDSLRTGRVSLLSPPPCRLASPHRVRSPRCTQAQQQPSLMRQGMRLAGSVEV